MHSKKLNRRKKIVYLFENLNFLLCLENLFLIILTVLFQDG